MELAEFEDLNTVQVSNERLLRVETNEIANLREAIASLRQLTQTLAAAERASDAVNVTERLYQSTPLDSFLEALAGVLERKVDRHPY